MFVNLPVKDLNKSIRFFTGLGFSFDPRFTDENATCMIISEDNYVMLLVERFFKSFTPKDISDSSGSTEVIISITAESRGKEDDMVDKALEAGASKSSENQDNGWMYQRGFQDPDGHLWEILYMDMSSVPPN
jgi:predicted lactoylglutathione lyase